MGEEVRASATMLWGLNLAASLAYAAGAAFMKASGGYQRTWPSVLVYVAFALGATFQTVAMRYQKLASGYTIVLGLEAVAAVGIGVFVFREALPLAKIFGILLVLGGVVLLRE